MDHPFETALGSQTAVKEPWERYSLYIKMDCATRSVSLLYIQKSSAQYEHASEGYSLHSNHNALVLAIITVSEWSVQNSTASSLGNLSERDSCINPRS